MKQETRAKEFVKTIYGKIASGEEVYSSCINGSGEDLFEHSILLEYSKEEIREAPIEALMGLGSGNPLVFFELHKGHTVLDLGSGAGLDSFLATNKVGDTGYVIGIDVTREMVRGGQKHSQ